ncbi:PREDICTED: tyrosine-protein phosphatase non-receptor type 11-like isoform X1 [Papilio xuthus]|uniref:protein-tyrosine-phosphatase n=1 Tax=Papilio xuthus TaxID=66420 RepID=A0AAJ7E4A0_PAPXU|nr:PREDICTED: tyrosine-protein phosphatase non-receptor type 11-like isoform X1 [Papilio xuthus]
MSKDSTRLSRVGVLAPAALSACMDASVLAVPAAGAIVSTVLKELSKAFMLKKWFHGIMSAKEAEQLIMEKGRNGSFLVRESLTHPGEYVLSVRVRGRVSHVMIRRQQDKYDVGSGEQFDDLVGLIEHFRSYPMTETSGDVLRLLQPVSGTCLRAKDIDEKVMEMDDIQKPDNKCGFDVEFYSLKLIEDMFVYTANEGAKMENMHKNRYRNIIPYDQTRVVLRRGSDDSHCSDYINANYIRSSRLSDISSSVQSSTESLNSVHSLILHRGSRESLPLVSKSLSDDALREVRKFMKLDKIKENKRRNIVKDKSYIATQGCLTNTVNDFWRMIWQEDVRVIAMITNEAERGKKKCERYWPLSGQKEMYNNLLVKSISETYYEDYLLREFDISDKTTCRTVYQYQFTAWPDHSIPAEPDGVLAFIDDINRRMRQNIEEQRAPEQNVLCVHCSAGVGRTGTFIVLDMLIDKIKLSGFNCDINVHNTVKLIRTQRRGMVQNKSQYRFIYLALKSYIDNNSSQSRKKIYKNEA